MLKFHFTKITFKKIIKQLPLFIAGGVFAIGAILASPTHGVLSSAGAKTATTPDSASLAEQSQIISVVNQASPAVVSIVATQELPVIQQNQFQDLCSDPFFQRYFPEDCQQSSQSPVPTAPQEVAAGTGFIVSSNGLIVTNRHVIDISGASYTVVTKDNKTYPASIVLKDPNQDIAILKINTTGLPTLSLGDSSTISVGQTAIAIGNALGQFSNTVSEGIVSGLARSITATENSGQSEQLQQVIQTDAAINLGNSGGPLLNLYGQVVGINTAIVQGAQNIGFAIPINNAKADISQVNK